MGIFQGLVDQESSKRLSRGSCAGGTHHTHTHSGVSMGGRGDYSRPYQHQNRISFPTTFSRLLFPGQPPRRF